MAFTLSIPKKLKERASDFWGLATLYVSDLRADLTQLLRRGGERLWDLKKRQTAH